MEECYFCIFVPLLDWGHDLHDSDLSQSSYPQINDLCCFACLSIVLCPEFIILQLINLTSGLIGEQAHNASKSQYANNTI